MGHRTFRPVLLFAVVLVGAALLFGASACASRVEPIYNVVNHPVPAPAQKLSLAEIGRTIAAAAAQYEWRIVPVGPNEFRATYDRHDHEAVIDITYSQSAYNISLVSSAHLRQENGEIHRTYNRWIRNLERSIEDRLYAASVAVK